jgi:hypothetical protein
VAATADVLLVQLAKLLDPIRLRLEDGRLVDLCRDVGLPLPASVAGDASVTNAANVAGTAMSTLPAKAHALAAAIDADNAGQIAAATGALLPGVVNAIAAARDLGAAIRNSFGGQAVSPQLQVVLNDLPRRLVDFSFATYLLEERARFGNTLALFGMIDNVAVPADGDRPTFLERRLRIDRLGTLLGDPAKLLTQLYGWGSPGGALNAPLLLARLRALLYAIGIRVTLVDAGPTGSPELAAFLFRVAPATGRPPGSSAALRATLDISNFTGLDLSNPLAGGWTGRVHAEGNLDFGPTVVIEPPATFRPEGGPPGLGGKFLLSFERTPVPGHGPLLLFGQSDSTRLTADGFTASIGVDFASGTGQLVIDAAARSGKFVLAFGGADGFLSSVLPTVCEVSFDLAVNWNAAHGVTLRGGAGLAVTVPLDVHVGPLDLDRLDLVFAPGTDGLTIAARITGGATIGPISATIEGIGIGTNLALRDGNLGPVDLTFRFVPPKGIGLSLDAGPISGGGYILFDEPAARYAGILELKLGVVGVQGVCLLDTRLPGGAKGYALLIVLRASFPPIQLGFGFALSSLGGLFALNRQIDVDAIRARMASGTIGRILAPEDPIRNAPLLISDLSAVFPPTDGVTVVGPTLQLSWVELVRFDVGVFIELPGPRKIVLLGSARVVLDNPAGDKPFLQIRLDIVGVIDFVQALLAFDAVLVDSQVLEILELTGGAAFRLSWGAEPYVVLTIGGFHPSYSPAPLVFPSSLTRIAMVQNGPILKMRFEGYFAITTNSIQFGAAIEAIIELGPFNIRGFISFDALIIFSPFHFSFAIHASVRVRWNSHTLVGLELDGQLSGPGPVVLHGRVSIEILFFEITFDETITLGSSTPPAVTPIASAVAELAIELADPANVKSSGATDPRVSIAPATNTSLPVVSPFGQAIWSQKRAPLDLLLQRFEDSPLVLPETVTATGPAVTGPDVDWFAPGSFAELSDADTLNRRAFERLHAGVKLGVDGVDAGPGTPLTVTVKQIRLPAPPRLLTLLALPDWLQRGVAGRVGSPERDPVTPAMAVRDEAWSVHATDGSVVHAQTSQAQAHQLATVGAAGIAVAATDHVPAMAF